MHPHGPRDGVWRIRHTRCASALRPLRAGAPTAGLDTGYPMHQAHRAPPLLLRHGNRNFVPRVSPCGDAAMRRLSTEQPSSPSSCAAKVRTLSANALFPATKASSLPNESMPLTSSPPSAIRTRERSEVPISNRSASSSPHPRPPSRLNTLVIRVAGRPTAPRARRLPPPMTPRSLRCRPQSNNGRMRQLQLPPHLPSCSRCRRKSHPPRPEAPR